MDDMPLLYHWEDGGTFGKAIHSSHIKTWLKCPKQFEKKYVNRDVEKQKYTSELGTGKVDHGVLKEQLRLKRDKKPLLEGEELSDLVSDLTESEADFMDLADATEFRRTKPELIKHAEVLTYEYVREINPIFVEKNYKIRFAGTDYYLEGRIDHLRELRKGMFQTSNGLNATESKIVNQLYAVDDLKTSKTSPPRNDHGGYKAKDGDWLQQTLYSMGAWVASGNKLASYQQTLNTTLYLVKNKTPILKPASYIVGANEVRFFIEVYRTFTKQLETGLFPPNPVGWHCSPKFCPVFNKCRKKEPTSFESLFEE